MVKRLFRENMRRCPDCKNDISKSAKKCIHCGCDIVLRDQIAAEESLNEEIKFLKKRGIITENLSRADIRLKWYDEVEKEELENKKKDFEPHMMYDPKTGKGYMAETYENHVRMDKAGYTTEKPEKFFSEMKESFVKFISILYKMINERRGPSNYEEWLVVIIVLIIIIMCV